MKEACKFVTGGEREVGTEQQSKPILILPQVTHWHDDLCPDLTGHPPHWSGPATALTGQGTKSKDLWM